MDSLVHAQTIGSSRVRKTLSGINKWVNSHDEDEDPLKKDNEDYDFDNRTRNYGRGRYRDF